MRQIVLSGLGDHVARKISTHGMNADDKKKLCHAYQVGGGASGCIEADVLCSKLIAVTAG